MPAAPVKGLGTLLKVTIASTLTTVGLRVSISGPDMSVGVKDLSTLDSTHAEKGPTIPDSGSISLSLFYDPTDATHTNLFTLANTPAVVVWALVIPTGTPATFTFSAILSKFALNGMEVDGYLGADVTLDITGAIVQT